MSSNKTTLTVGVAGMMCGSCVNTVTNALKGLGPDVEAKVNLASGTAQVSGSSITFDSVTEAIEACGFTAGPCGIGVSSKGGKCSGGEGCTCGDSCQCGSSCSCSDCPGLSDKTAVTVGVAGMTCSSCVKSVTAALKALGPDVVAFVSLTSGTAHVSGSSITADAVKAAIEDCGFTAGACGMVGDSEGRCSGGSGCTCGDDCECGTACRCADCPGVCGTSADPYPAKADDTCTCGPSCACGAGCNCSGCPGIMVA